MLVNITTSHVNNASLPRQPLLEMDYMFESSQQKETSFVNTTHSNSMGNVSAANGTLVLFPGEDEWWGDPSADMTDTYHQAAVFAVRRVLLPAVVLLGGAGLAVTAAVLARPAMRSPTNVHLSWLTAADAAFLLLLASTRAGDGFTPHSREFYLYSIYVSYASVALHVLLLTSVWLTVALAAQRYVAICHPFLAAKLCTITRARLTVAGIFVCAALCRLPNLWENRVVSVRDPATNTTLTYLEVTDLSFDPTYMAVFPVVVDGVLTSLVPFLALLVLNTRLAWEVRRSTRYLLQRNGSGSNGIKAAAAAAVEREERQVTVMLVAVVLVFFLCQAPYVTYTAMVSIRQFSAPSRNLMLFRYVAMFLLTLKSAVNFVLYCWFSEKFWATFKRLFRIRQIMHTLRCCSACFCCQRRRQLRRRRSSRRQSGSVSGSASSYSFISRMPSVVSATTRNTYV